MIFTWRKILNQHACFPNSLPLSEDARSTINYPGIIGCDVKSSGSLMKKLTARFRPSTLTLTADAVPLSISKYSILYNSHKCKYKNLEYDT